MSSLLAASPINPFFSHHLHVCRTIIHNIALWCVLVYFYNSYWHKLQTRTVNYFFTFLFPFRFFLFFFPLIDVTRFALAFFSSSFFPFGEKVVQRGHRRSSVRCYSLSALRYTGKRITLRWKRKKKIDSIGSNSSRISHLRAFVRIYIYIFIRILCKKNLIFTQRNDTTRHEYRI